jgi:hypothetical protein
MATYGKRAAGKWLGCSLSPRGDERERVFFGKPRRARMLRRRNTVEHATIGSYNTVYVCGPAMHFSVRYLRHRGRVIPWKMVVNQPAKVGDLRIEDSRDEELHRYVRTAKLFPDKADEAVLYSGRLPELHDVRIICMSPQAFTLAGFERIDGAEYAQSWLVGSR